MLKYCSAAETLQSMNDVLQIENMFDSYNHPHWFLITSHNQPYCIYYLL